MKSLVFCVLLSVACSTSPATSTDLGNSQDFAIAASDLGSAAQLPPTGASALQAWLATSAYKAWHCETAVHDQRSPSPHGKNRICSNDVLSAAGAGVFPEGSAAVKELYDAAGTKITGYAVSRHLSSGTGGDSWYWFEIVGTDVAADGPGSSGVPKTVCVGCHMGAGSDAQHSRHPRPLIN